MYTKEGISYIVRSDLLLHNLELICIEVQPLRCEPFDIGFWYTRIFFYKKPLYKQPSNKIF